MAIKTTATPAIVAAPGFWPLPGPEAGKGSLCIEPWFGQAAAESPAFQAGLRPHHRIVAVDGRSPDLTGRAFLVWVRSTHEPGDPVVLRVEEGEGAREIAYRLAGR